MERKLVRGGLYGFIIGLLIGLLVLSDSETVRQGQGITTTVYEPIRVYIMKLIRFASIISLVTMAVIWLKETLVFAKNKATLMVLIRNFSVAFVTLLVVTLIVSFIVNRIA